MSIKSKIELQDGVTAKLLSIINAMTKTVSAMEMMQKAAMIDTSGIDLAASSAENLSDQLSGLNKMSVSPNVNYSSSEADASMAENAIAGVNAESLAGKTVEITADASMAENAIAGVNAETLAGKTIGITADASQAENAIAGVNAEALAGKTVEITADASQAENAIAVVNAESLAGKTVGITADTSQAENAIDGVNAETLAGKTMGITADASQAENTIAGVNAEALAGKTIGITADASQAENTIAGVNAETLAGKTMGITADASQAENAIADVRSSQVGNKSFNIDADASMAENAIAGVNAETLAGKTVEITADASQAENAIAGVNAESLAGKTVEITADASMAENAIAGVNAEALAGKTVGITVDASMAENAIAGVNAEALAGKTIDITADASQAENAIAGVNAEVLNDKTANITFTGIEEIKKALAEAEENITGKKIDIKAGQAISDAESLKNKLGEAASAASRISSPSPSFSGQEQIENMNDKLKQSANILNNNRNQQSRWKSEIDESSRSAENLSDGFSKIGKMILGMSAIRGIFGLVSGQMDSALKRMDTMSNYSRTMTAITGSANQAEKSLEQLKGMTKGTAYGLDTAAQSLQNFVTRGLTTKQATALVGSWMDAVSFYGSGTNEQLYNVTDAIGKMLSKGKVEMDQLDRLTDAGINAVGIYAAATNQSTASVQADLSKGKISAEQFIGTVSSAMEGGSKNVTSVADAAKKAGTTWTASIDNMKAAVTRGIVSVVDSINSSLTSNGLPTMLEMIQNFGATAENVLGDIGIALSQLIDIIAPLVNIAQSVAQGFVDNWSLIAPIVIGVAAAITTVKIATIAYKAVLAVTNILQGLSDGLFSIWAAHVWLASDATFAATASQWGFNAALLACPLTWIVLAIIAVIGALYLGVAAFNKLTGASVSATGIIAGVVSAAAAVIGNIFIALWNIGVEIVQFIANAVVNGAEIIKATVVASAAVISNIWSKIYNLAVSIAEGVINTWNTAVYNVKNFFWGLEKDALSSFSVLAHGAESAAETIANVFTAGANKAIQGVNWIIKALNKLPGVSLDEMSEIGNVDIDLSSDIDNKLAEVQQDIPSEPEKVSFERKGYSDVGKAFADTYNQKNIDLSKYEANYLDVGKFWSSGYNWGKNKADSISNMFDPKKVASADNKNSKNKFDTSDLKSISSNTGDTAKNTAKSSKNLDDTKEELKYLRDIASRDIVNRFTTASINVKMTNNNKISSKMDLDGITNHLKTKIEKEMLKTAKGAY